MSKIKIGVIAAAGKGTRAYPRTTFIPKPLFQIEGKSFLLRNVQLLIDTFAVEKIYILVGHLKEQVIAEIDAIRKIGVPADLQAMDWTTKGLASDIASLQDKIDSPFLTILGDEFYYKSNHGVFLASLEKQPRAECLIGVLKTSILSRIRKNYSVELENNDRVKHLVEKPVDPPNQYLGLGSYYFTPKYFEFFRQTPPSAKSGVIEITEVIDKMARETKQVYATHVQCDYFNINSMQDYHQAVYEVRNDLFSKYKVSLIIPTYNNERSISDVLHDFQNKVHEMILVDSGSEDQTLQLAKEFQSKTITIDANGNKNLGERVRKGIAMASGDIAIVISPGGEFRSKDFPKLLEYLKDCDMVVGTRTTRQMIEQGSNLKPIPRLLNLIMGKLVEVFWWSQEPRFTDVDCRYMAVWKESFEKILPSLTVSNKFYTVEMMIEIVRAHMRCIEIPVSYHRPVEQTRYGFLQAVSDAFSILQIILKKKLG
ncbi:MAG: sugar phosphate nucleotidyltransferase [Spirochaetota bacterium]